MEFVKMEQSTQSQPTKRKRAGVAKNRKKAWRKHSNIKDVEDFMDDQRMQLRTGGLISEKPDESLFFVDNKHPPQDEGESKKNLEKPLKIDRKLMPDPRIPVARISRTPKSSERPKRKSKLVQRLEEEGKWGPSSTVKRRKLTAALRDSDKAEKDKDDDQKRRECGRAVYDLWGAPVPAKTKTEGTPNEHYLRVTKKTRKQVPKTYYNKTSCFNAVEVVSGGASYNPTFEDHQELIQKAIQVELDMDKKEEKLNRWHRFAKVSRAEMERTSMAEMTEGLFEDGHNPEEEAKDDGDDDVLPSAPVVAERRKTRKQRNKEKQISQQTKKAHAEKAEKIRLHEVYRLRSLKREIKEKEEKIATKIKQKKAKAQEDEGKTKRLGRYKYEELPIPVKLSEHLVGNLRRLKPEGSLIVDRFNNLQKRNMIEPRIWKKGMKPKMKEYEKKTFKEIKLAE
ncbi:ribosome biogenesis protein NOP53 [Strongylocentrotus purpuratus]|uniref:Ribosome biogenesis protein NOP53 n=1 Tax=Strongylocentrotus purpuratus TaxID=7668 RepID=A0A7M7T5G2_STRPU|nr:ribosome biogenesis protein NOP53 [Strongylocentrotus purpuratus]